MKIMNLRAERNGASGLARFDIEISPEMTLKSMLLRRNGKGEFRTAAPNFRGESSAHFSPALASQITAAAVAEYDALDVAQG